jgi:hypothetical protein
VNDDSSDSPLTKSTKQEEESKSPGTKYVLGDMYKEFMKLLDEEPETDANKQKPKEVKSIVSDADQNPTTPLDRN